MRPAPIHATDSSSKQYVSNQASTSSKSTNNSTQMNKPNGSTRTRSKKDNPGVGKQLAPGLLSLSKPIDEFQDSDDAEKSTSSSKKQIKKKKQHQQGASADPSSVATSNIASNAPGKAKKKALAIDEIKADANQLSRSAPDSHSSSDWEMPHSAKLSNDATSNAALTWQQQLLNSQAPKSATLEKKKGGKKDKRANASIKSKSSQAVDVSKNDASSALTWQQELFGSNNKARGPAFDVFADERDALTFGGNTSHQPPNKAGKKKQRQRADSLGDIDVHHNNNTAGHARPNKAKGNNHSSFVHLGANGAASSSPSSGPPTTPNKLAYAGPNFHNSPSPASLPVPKFLQSKTGGVVNGTISSSMSANATSNSSLFAREAQAQQQQQFYQQPQPVYHHPPPPPYPPFSQYPHPGPYNHPAQYVDPNVSISSHSSDEEQDSSFSHSKSRYIRGVTAPPELPSSPLMNGTGDDSVNSVGNNRNETIENLLARMMRPGSE